MELKKKKTKKGKCETRLKEIDKQKIRFGIVVVNKRLSMGNE